MKESEIHFITDVTLNGTVILTTEGTNKVVDGMNHLFRDQAEPAMLKLKSIYKKSLAEPLSQELLSILEDWA